MTDLARAAVLEHVAAFTAHDTPRLLAGLTDDVVWATGGDVITGKQDLSAIFDDGLWGLDPSLQVRRLVVDGAVVAAELIERLTVDGEVRTFSIAAFFELLDGLIAAVKVYREGTADVD